MFCEKNPIVETAKALAWIACINYQQEFVVNVSRTGGMTSCYVKRKNHPYWKIRISDHRQNKKEPNMFSFHFKDDDAFGVALKYLGR